MKIVFFESKDWEKKYLKEKLKGQTLVFVDEPLSDSNVKLAKSADAISVFIYSKVSANCIKKMPKLKMIATRSTGFDHIDLKEAAKRKICVSNVPFYGENTVAEHTFALILSLSRKVHQSYMRTLRDDFSIDGLTGFDLKGRTIGIVGGGHIGLHVARIAKGFEMNVLVYDVHPNAELAKKIGFTYAKLSQLLAKSDVISLHAPYIPQTHHIINKKALSKVKTGAILINTARGGLIDTEALLWALETKKLAGAGLDVIEGEDLIQEEHELLHKGQSSEAWRTVVRNHLLFRMDNVVFTPHNAFNSTEALHRILDTTIANLQAYKKNVCPNQVVLKK